MTNNRSHIRAQNYSGARFSVPTWGPIPGPSTTPGPAGDWGVDFHGTCVSMTSKPQVQSDHQSSLVRTKWVHPFFCHESTKIHEYDQSFPSLACHRQKEQTYENLSVHCVSSYHAHQLDFLPPIQENCHWLKYVGVRIGFANFYVNVVVSLSVPLILNHYVTQCLQFVTPMTDILL